MFDENTLVGFRNRLETRKLYLQSVLSPGRGSVIKTLKRVDLTRGTKIVGSDRIPTAVTSAAGFSAVLLSGQPTSFFSQMTKPTDSPIISAGTDSAEMV